MLFRNRSGDDDQYYMNSEAMHVIRHVAETANKNRGFTLSEVDFSEFGQKVMDVDFDGRTLLFDSQNELKSLISLTSESSSGYSSASTSTSALSSCSVGIPAVKR